MNWSERRLRVAEIQNDPELSSRRFTVGRMAKKRPKPEKRTDAERRARQSERLSRHFRVLQCIMGSGRWDAEALSQEIEVSPRTIHRIMQTLAMANVPWYFCKDNEWYRVREGFRFPGLEPGLKKGSPVGIPTKFWQLLAGSSATANSSWTR